MSDDIRLEFVSDPDADQEEIDALTRALRDEILELDEVDARRGGQGRAGVCRSGT